MNPALQKSELTFQTRPSQPPPDQQPQTPTLEVISHDMQTSDLYKVIETAVRHYTETKERNLDYSNEEQFYMLVARHISEKLEALELSDGSWQVILGQNYGSFVTHESFYFVNFKYDGIWFTIYVST